MSGISNPHDALFRETLSRRETAISFVRENLPDAVVECLDLESLEIGRDSFRDPALRAHLSDFICRVRLRDGGSAHVYVLVEHKTTAERLVALQLLRYVTQIWHQHVRQGHGFPLPPVIPLVFYHGPRRWTLSTDFSAVFQCPKELEPFLPRFRYLLTDLTNRTDEEIRGIELLLAPLLAMRHYYDDDLLSRVPRILRVLADVISTERGVDALTALLSYLSSTDRVPDRELEVAVEEAFPGGEGERIMATIADRWIQRGATAKAREAVLEVLETRFHNLPLALRTRIDKIKEQDVLSRLHKTAVTASSLEDFERELTH